MAWRSSPLKQTTSTHQSHGTNVRGLSLDGLEGLDLYTQDQIALNIDIQALSEHCLDTTKFSVTQQIYDKITRQLPGQVVTQFNSSSETAVSTYKPGGTAMIVLGNLVGRVNQTAAKATLSVDGVTSTSAEKIYLQSLSYRHTKYATGPPMLWAIQHIINRPDC